MARRTPGHDGRDRVAATAGLWLLVLAAVVLPRPATPAGTDGVQTYDLVPAIRGVVTAEGAILLETGQGAVSRTLLSIEPPLRETRRAGEDAPPPFTGVFTEGTPGGHRGFAREADDDGDGLVDEDPVNGRDDDGDGLVDEDFAAVSDVMAVVDRTGGGRRFHLETYHWGHAHLRPSLMLSAGLTDLRGDPRDGALTCKVDGSRWYEGDLTWRRHGHIGQPEEHRARLLVAAVPDPTRPGEQLWIGISPLSSAAAAADPAGRLRLAGERLEIPLVDGRREIAVAVAPTLLQLRADLSCAHAVHLGAAATDKSPAVPWIVPLLCPACRQGELPEIRWEPGPGDSGRLVCLVHPGQNALLDPDRFVLDERPLGSPEAIEWRTAEDGSAGDETAGARLAWRSWTAADAAARPQAQLDPYLAWPGFEDHTASGELAFTFASPPRQVDPGKAPVLEGACLGGRRFTIELPEWIEEVVPDASADADRTDPAARLAADDRRKPMLAPDLLSNFPNPFQDQTTIRYRVPETVEEGFVWEEGEEPTLDPAAAIPYRSSPPLVTLKIYSLGGTEIATLEVGNLDIGDYQARWDGTDTLGRPVASGTYFCKLQIEDWSVTKRVVFLR